MNNKSTEPAPEMVFLDIDIPLARDLFRRHEQQTGRAFSYNEGVEYLCREFSFSTKRAGVIVETVGIKPAATVTRTDT